MSCPKPAQNVAPVGAACDWCNQQLPCLDLKSGASGDAVKKLHEHLKAFGMTVELSDWKEKDGTFEDSADISKGTWGKPTTRAVRMFGLHPAVGSETARVLKVDGSSITADLATKFQDWCRGKIVSPAHYWDMKDLKITDGDLDAAGAHADPSKQTVLHDFIVQIEKDLMKTGFAVHDDAVCDLGAKHKPKGVFVAAKASQTTDKKGRPLTVHEDPHLTDVTYLVRKFQRQAQWLWRMKADGTHQPDAASSDASVYGGSTSGEVDALTAKVLHLWATQDLHMVMNKYALKKLDWPPGSGHAITVDDSSVAALLREDAHAAWLAAATEIEQLKGTLQGPYASSPRGYKSGKAVDKDGKPKKSASDYSWHYSALAVDICEGLQMGDGTISDKSNSRYGLEPDGDKFKIWCRLVPHPDPPSDPADDYKDLKNDKVQYRNRNIPGKHVKGSSIPKIHPKLPTEKNPLYFATNHGSTVKPDVTALEGWYVNITKILEDHGMNRIPRHHDWEADHKAWEWWHYQYEPADPPGGSGGVTFGDYLQLYGVHEYKLRRVPHGWTAHEDIEHDPG
jgi:hypothetical protein